MTVYLVTYTAIARNVATGDLAAQLGAIPRDTATETLLGLVSLADVVTQAPPFVTRAMSYTSTVNPMIPNPQLGAMLTNFYTATFSQLLSCPVVPSPVSTVGVDVAPIFWARGDAAPGALVARWPDLSGFGNDAVQASSPQQPTRVVNSTIEALTIHFGGAQVLDTPLLTFDACTYLLTFQSPGPAGFLFERGAGIAGHSGENMNTSAPDSSAVRRNGVTHFGNAPGGWGTDNVWHLAVLEYSDTVGGTFLVDGTEVATFAALSAESVSAILHLGAETGPLNGLTGDLREVLVFPNVLDASSLAAASAYMRAQITP